MRIPHHFLRHHHRSSSSTTTTSSSSSSSSFPWIVPLNLPNPKTTTTTSCPSVLPRNKFLSHENAAALIRLSEDPQKALNIFNEAKSQKGFNHNHATYSAILHNLAAHKKFKAVDAVLAQMSLEPCKLQEPIFINLMIHYSKSSLPENVYRIFYSLQHFLSKPPSIQALITCLSSLLESDCLDLAHKVLSDLPNLKLKPSSCVFNLLIKYHCRRNEIDAASAIFERMKREEFEPDVATYTVLMSGFCDQGRTRDAVQLFEEMLIERRIAPEKQVYNVLVSGLCKSGKVEAAKKLMEFMRKKGCKPNVVNYGALIGGLCVEGKMEEARLAMEEMRESGGFGEVVSYTVLMGCMCKAGRVDEAMELMGEMGRRGHGRDGAAAEVMIGGFCREGRLGEAMGLLGKIVGEGVELSKSSYRILLNSTCKDNGCDHTSTSVPDPIKIEMGMSVLEMMIERGLMPQDTTSYKLLIGLCRVGWIGDAIDVLERLVMKGFVPEYETWGCLVEVVCKERRIAMGVFEQLTRGLGTNFWVAKRDRGLNFLRYRKLGWEER